MLARSYDACCKEGVTKVAPKKPTKKQLSEAGKRLQKPHTRESKESEAAKTLRKGRKSK